MRIWTCVGGNFRLQARLFEANKDAVVLEKEDGVQVTVPCERLSRADLDYLAQRTASKQE